VTAQGRSGQTREDKMASRSMATGDVRDRRSAYIASSSFVRKLSRERSSRAQRPEVPFEDERSKLPERSLPPTVSPFVVVWSKHEERSAHRALPDPRMAPLPQRRVAHLPTAAAQPRMGIDTRSPRGDPRSFCGG
jgi:hypothetical protein